MPVSINTSTIKYRDQQGIYQPINALKGDNGASDAIAPAYEDLTYPVTAGQGCIHEGLYYVAKQAITIQENWIAAHWEQKTIHEELQQLRENSGGGGIQDIRVNGKSIVSNEIATIPIADNNSTLGLVKINERGSGLFILNGGMLDVNPASASSIKNGLASNTPIAPQYQHHSVFYGLAKAAGDSTQSASSNDVGTYTNQAKFSIQKMLGIVDESKNILSSNGITLGKGTADEVTITPKQLKSLLNLLNSPSSDGLTDENGITIETEDGEQIIPDVEEE